jgi:hypothetical protein
MNKSTSIIGFIFVAGLLGSMAPDAQARKRHHDSFRDRIENRRDARRAGIAAGAVASMAVSASANSRVRARYEECLVSTGYDPSCEHARYEDERRARQSARRTGVLVGATARAIVRD